MIIGGIFAHATRRKGYRGRYDGPSSSGIEVVARISLIPNRLHHHLLLLLLLRLALRGLSFEAHHI